MTTLLINIRDTKEYDVYIGRGSIFGNPFVIGKDGTREEVIEKYEIWIRAQPELIKKVKQLQGLTLACYCFPLKCHGDILIKIINEG